ncbi:MAG: class I SAM-dependent methyltransferase [Thermoplasmata archaeon]
MRLDWKIDQDARTICWKDLMDAPREMVEGRPFTVILDLGTSNGAFGNLISMDRETRIIGVDISRGGAPSEHVEFVRADILHLPFKDESFDLVSARAILHHVPDDVERAVEEAGRVLRSGQILICQEPTSDNLVSELARRIFRTVLHDPSERAFSSARLERAMSGSLTMLEARYHLIFAYLLPHLASRFRGRLRRMLLGLSRLLVQVDERLLAKGRFWRRRAAYVTVSAVKSPAQEP